MHFYNFIQENMIWENQFKPIHNIFYPLIHHIKKKKIVNFFLNFLSHLKSPNILNKKSLNAVKNKSQKFCFNFFGEVFITYSFTKFGESLKFSQNFVIFPSLFLSPLNSPNILKYKSQNLVNNCLGGQNMLVKEACQKKLVNKGGQLYSNFFAWKPS